MKKKLWILLALTVVIALFCCGAALADQTGNLNDAISWTLTDGGTLTISGSGAIPDYAIRTKPTPFKNSMGIQKVIIGSGITRVGNCAFTSCATIKNVSFPSSLTSIGTEAFNYCAGLTAVSLPAMLTTISRYAFGNTGLTSVTIPKSVTTIGDYSFYNCDDLYSVTIENSSAAIGTQAFGNCAGGLTLHGYSGSTAQSYATANGLSFTTTISGSCGDNVTYSFDPATGALIISGTGAMNDYGYGKRVPWEEYRESITSVSVGSGVNHIGDIAFAACDGLTSVTIADTVTSIGNEAFYWCTGLNSIIIPDSVASIGRTAFHSCTNLTSIALPASLTGISMYSFYFCTSLASVTIPDNVTVIESMAFQFCSNLASVTIPDSVTSIGEYAFYGCIGLKSLRIGNSVEYIGKSAFESCNSLTSVTFPQSVTEIDDNAFAACEKLSHATFYNRNTVMESGFHNTALYGGGTIHGWTGSTAQAYTEEHSSINFEPLGSIAGSCGANVTYSFDPLTGALTISGSGAMADCSDYRDSPWFAHRYAIRSVSIGNGVTVIGDYAFIGSGNMTSAAIPGSVTRIGRSAFSECASLFTANIQSKVNSIGDYVFYGCSSLRQVFIHNADIAIGEYAFDECPGLTICGYTGSTAQTYASNKGIPFETLDALSGSCGDNVTYSFDPATGVLTISGTGMMLGYYPASIAPWYGYRDAITSVSIGSSVTRIGSNDFNNCSSLTSVIIPNSVTSIGDKAFYGCTGLISATVNNSAVTIDTNAFTDCSPLLVIHGWLGSTAQTYAQNAGIAFEPMEALSGSCGDNLTWSIDAASVVLTISGTGEMTAFEDVDEVPWYNYRESIASVNIGSGVTSITKRAFYECTGLTSVTIPASVTRVDFYAFRYCASLTSATVMNPDCVIGDSDYDVFKNCAAGFTLRGYSGSTAEVYAANIKNPCAFELVAPAPDFFLPAELTKIEADAFRGISAHAVVIPKTVTYFSGNPFAASSVTCIYGFPGYAAETLAQNYPAIFTFIPLTDAWYARLTN